MRISDWSSDVCSSDLQAPSPVRGAERTPVAGWRHGWRQAVFRPTAPRAYGWPAPWRRECADARGDRKSVVLGKSVSVRVDLGGRRIIKKKITYIFRLVFFQTLSNTRNSTSTST